MNKISIAPSPSTTISASPSPPTPNDRIESTYLIEDTIKNQKYIPIKKIAETLQGCIWEVSRGQNTYIIKVTDQQLHNKHMANWNGNQIKISEDIEKEAAILKYLSLNDPPSSLVKYVDFFCDKFNYFLVMEYGGEISLFEFVKICHQYIDNKVLEITEWQRFCKIAMKQMVDLIDWMHNTMHCCHLDLSCENFVIDNVMVAEHLDSKTITFEPGFKIRIIDFGLAEVFGTHNECNQIDFRCRKYVGKTQYKAPEVYEKKEIFDARCADCWSLSVVFFILIVGCPPWQKPSIDDPFFNLIINGSPGHLRDLLIKWHKIEYITPYIFNLMALLFQKEKCTLTIKEIKRHPFFL